MRKAGINLVLTLSVAGSVLAGILILVFYVSQSSLRMATQLQEQSLVKVAQATSQTLELYLEDAADVVRALSTQDAVLEGLSGSPNRARDRFRNYIDSYNHYWAIFAFDAKGVIVAGFNATGQDMAGGSRADRDYVKAVLGGKDLTFDPKILAAKTGDILIFVVAKAVRDRDGKLLGGVAVCPKWTDFTKKFIDPLRFGQRGYGFMLDADGTFIAHATDKSMILRDMRNEGFIKEALARQNGVISYDWGGERKFMAMATVATTGWLVCMSAYESEMTATARQQRTILLCVGALALLLAAAVIIAVNRSLVLRPLLAVEHYTQSITSGDLRAGLTGTFRFELGILAANLRRMVAELKNKLGFAQGVLAGIPAPCAIVGPDSRVLWLNRQVIDLLELACDPQSAKGQLTGELFYGDPDRETMSQKTIREGRGLSVDVDFTTRSGRLRHLHVDTTLFHDMDGVLLGCLVFWTDQTAILAQAARLESQNAAIAQAAAEASQVSEQMVAAAGTLAGQIGQANQGAQAQHHRVQETVTAVEEMNATILEVAKNAGETANSAEAARAKAREGAELVVQVVTAVGTVRQAAEGLKTNMHGLGEQARGIGAVLGVISDIADQTNLLALNAAIEAARAGEAGRGFAVVADEVRKLAEKTMLATKEVGQAITGIQRGTAETVTMVDRAAETVTTATSLAERSGAALTEIVARVEAAGDQVRSIATAAEQQSATSEEINRSVEEISRIASETAATMDLSASAVAELADQAQSLAALVAGIQANETKKALE